MNGAKRLMGLALVGFLLLAGCAGAAKTPAAAEPIKIGVSVPVTGFLNRYTEGLLDGIRWAVEEANAEGGAAGRPLELIVMDNKSTVADAVENVRELIYERGVDFLHGGIMSGACLAQAEIALEAKVPLFHSCMTDYFTFAKGNRYTFRVHQNTWLQGAAGAELAVAKFPNAKRFYTLASDYEFGRALTERVIQHLKEIKPDAEIVGQAWPSLAEMEYTPYITAILAAKPDVVFVNLGLVGPFYAQALPVGLMQKVVIINPGWNGPDDMVLMKKEQLPIDAWMAGIPWYAVDFPKNKEFVQKIRDRFARDPVSATYMGYLNIRFLIEGIRKAGTADREKVIDALEGLTLDTPVGPITLGEFSHQGRMNYWLGKVKWDESKGYGVLTETMMFSGEKLLPSEDEIRKMREAAK